MAQWVSWAIVLGLAATTLFAEPVRFRTQIQPLLADRCFSCHGQDAKGRAAGLRLDTREGALENRRNGAAIVPGNPAASQLLARIAPENPKRVMPPPYSHKQPLQPDEVALFRQWITEGANYEKHWAFQAPEKPSLPALGGKHPVDLLVQRRLQQLGLKPAPPAPRSTLARRLSFALLGLPPEEKSLQAFLADQQPGAYARYVDQLLASPHYGERMAMWWLDAARYSDTDGFQADANRTNWPWRDWVVEAFNRNMPYDQFTREQLAGDLLPNATDSQRLATSFHRNHMTNGEGGRDPEESRIDYVMDRVNTTGTVWLGLTLGCTQCHSHKFDPISHHDYYSLNAFFNSIDEDGRAGNKAKPYLSVVSPYTAAALAEAQQLLDQRKAAEQKALRAAEPAFAAWLRQQRASLPPNFQAWRHLPAKQLESTEGTQLKQDPASGLIKASGPNPRQDDYRIVASLPGTPVTGLRLEVFPPYSRGASGEFLLTDIKVQVRRRGSAQIRDLVVSSAIASYEADKEKNNNYGLIRDTLDDDPRNGWTTLGGPKTAHTAHFTLAEPLRLQPEEELLVELRHRSTVGDQNLANFRLSFTDQAGPALSSLEAAPLEQLALWQASQRQAAKPSSPAAAPAKEAVTAPIPSDLQARLREQFLVSHAPYAAAKAALQRAQRQFDEVKAAQKVDVMVMAERPQPRQTHVLLRGVWDKKGDVVTPDVPAAIFPWPEGEPKNRLGLANWILHPKNPLTARVAVNHLWQLLFGNGLVPTTEDFGVQGERPEQAELLDWLAVDFMENGWDVKRLLRQIVLSETFQQSSNLSKEMAERDPANKYLARGPRFRLPAWMLRDAALQYAGLLQPTLGGPPVRPYQPPGVWEELFMGRFQYEPSEGTAQYRRTLYAFWRRTIAPTYLFDSAQRRSCEVRVARTNTPLQALTLLNDQIYLEAARALADLAVAAADGPPRSSQISSAQISSAPLSSAKISAHLAQLFTRVAGRPPRAEETALLLRQWQTAYRTYLQKPQEARRLLAVGQFAAPQEKAPENLARRAAYLLVGSLLLNLDEVLSYE